jgi:hypothetical protein
LPASSYGKNLAHCFFICAMSKDLASLAMIPNLTRPAPARPIQPVRTSEALIALAFALAIAMLLGAGTLIGRMQWRRKDRTRIQKGPLGPRSGSRGASPQRNLRLVSRKRR